MNQPTSQLVAIISIALTYAVETLSGASVVRRTDSALHRWGGHQERGHRVALQQPCTAVPSALRLGR